MSAHTPGPLTFADHRNDGFMILTERGIPIAHVDCREDATLFAAAPDLLAACKALAESISIMARDLDNEPCSILYDDTVLEAIRAAIAKAEGRA